MEVRELRTKIGELTVVWDYFLARIRSLSRTDRIRMIYRASSMKLSKQRRLLGGEPVVAVLRAEG